MCHLTSVCVCACARLLTLTMPRLLFTFAALYALDYCSTRYMVCACVCLCVMWVLGVLDALNALLLCCYCVDKDSDDIDGDADDAGVVMLTNSFLIYTGDGW